LPLTLKKRKENVMEYEYNEYRRNRAWAEVNLDCIEHNIKEIKRYVGKKTSVMAVVKADAYGHGVMQTAKTLLNNGADCLAVSMLDEALQLRNNGIEAPILVLSYTDPKRADEIVINNITQTIFSHDLAIALSDASERLGKRVKIHIKIDTGMTRVGFMPGYSAVKNVVQISQLPGLILEGLYTHFASADETDKTYTKMQFEKFTSIWNELNRIGIFIPIKHVANSAAIIDCPEMHLNMVRPGVILYGLYPSSDVNRAAINLKPAMTLKANVILVKAVEKNISISYGRIFTTKRESKIATLPIGYADGYSRTLSEKARVLINGEYANVVGRICMDQCMIDVTDIKHNVLTGDEVVLFGAQKDKSISIEEISEKTGTINYETVCIIGKRIPRVYLSGGKISKIHNYLI